MWWPPWRERKTRFRLQTLFQLFYGAPFFEPGPIMGKPGPHQRLITFPCIGSWRLWTPPEGLQPTGQIVGMIVDAKLHHNQRADPLQCPALCLKTSLQRSLSEPLQYVLPLGSRQSRWTARHRAAPQAGGIMSVLPEVLRPFTDRHPADAHTAGDLRLGQLAGLQQPGSFQATFFTLGTGKVSWLPDHRRQL